MWTYNYICPSELYHHGVKGQKWGVRRYQNPDGSLKMKRHNNLINLEDKGFNKTHKVVNKTGGFITKTRANRLEKKIEKRNKLENKYFKKGYDKRSAALKAETDLRQRRNMKILAGVAIGTSAVVAGRHFMKNKGLNEEIWKQDVSRVTQKREKAVKVGVALVLANKGLKMYSAAYDRNVAKDPRYQGMNVRQIGREKRIESTLRKKEMEKERLKRLKQQLGR